MKNPELIGHTRKVKSFWEPTARMQPVGKIKCFDGGGAKERNIFPYKLISRRHRVVGARGKRVIIAMS